MAIAVVVLRGAGRRSMLPYGPSLAAGGVVALFFADPLIDAWLS